MREALDLDRLNGDHEWAESMQKEMDALDRLDCFACHDPNEELKKEEGWQWAPLTMIFDIKAEDKRKKSRLVCGGHVLDSNRIETCSSVANSTSV